MSAAILTRLRNVVNARSQGIKLSRLSQAVARRRYVVPALALLLLVGLSGGAFADTTTIIPDSSGVVSMTELQTEVLSTATNNAKLAIGVAFTLALLFLGIRYMFRAMGAKKTGP